MANNVAFLRGPQANFDGLKSFNAGAFYLTEDAGRLYYANSETSCLELNQYVHQVASFDELASSFASAQVGDFYYAIKENVLCTKKEGATSWTQINKNTNDDTKVTSVSFKRDETVTDKIKMNLVLKQVTKHIDNTTTEVADVIGSFELTENDFNAIVDGANVSVGAAFETNKAIIKTAGIGADSADAGVSIAGAGSVTVSGSEDNIVITGVNTTYELDSPAGKAEIVLTGSDNVANTIAFANGNDDIVVTGANEDEIKIAHKAYNDVADPITADQTPAAGEEFNIVSGVELSNGHVVGVNTAKVKLPGEKWYTVSGVAANNEGDLIVTVKDQANTETEVKAEKQLYYKVGDALVYNQGDLKDYFYTEAEIDDKLNGLNAMTYRGTVGTTSNETVAGSLAALPIEGVKIGDTYMVVGADGVVYKGSDKAGAGDLLIATGVEENGVITSGLAWTYVPSANEIDTTYDLLVEGNSIVLKDSDNNEDIVLLEGDSHIATAQNTDASGIVISHKDVARNDGDKGAISPAAKASFDVVQEVTSDAKGHITAVKTTTVTLPEDKDTTYSLDLDAGNKRFALKDSGNNEKGAVKVDGDGVVEVAAAVEAGVLGYSLSHANVARNDGDVKTQGLINEENKNKFAVVTGVTSNEQGHITAVEKTEFTLPAEVTYTLSGAVVNAVEGGVSITDTLTNSNNVACGTSVYNLKSESLKVANTNNNVTVELEWGTF